MYALGAVAAPRGGAKGGELSSTNVAGPDFRIRALVRSSPWSEGRGRPAGGVEIETGAKRHQRELYSTV